MVNYIYIVVIYISSELLASLKKHLKIDYEYSLVFLRRSQRAQHTGTGVRKTGDAKRRRQVSRDLACLTSFTIPLREK